MSTRNPAIAMAALITIGGLLAACSAAPAASPGASSTATPPLQTPAASPSPSPSARPALAAELVVRVTTEGGFIGPAAHLAQLPVVVVYADGRIFTPAPVDAIYPGPLLPVESVRTVDPAGLAAIRAAIATALLDAGGGTNPGIGADAADTVFAVQADGTLVTTRFPALGAGGHGPGQPGGGPGGSPDPQREAALALLARLTDTTDLWGGPAAVITPVRPDVVPGLRGAWRPGRLGPGDKPAPRRMAALDAAGLVRQARGSRSRDRRPAGRCRGRRGRGDARPGPGGRDAGHAVLVGRHRVHALRDPAPPGRNGRLTGARDAGAERAVPRSAARSALAAPGGMGRGTRRPHVGLVDVARFPHRTAPAVPQRRGARPG